MKRLAKTRCIRNLMSLTVFSVSVGIALSGGSTTVLLDEPSTGMDVSGKRDLWDMLLKMKVENMADSESSNTSFCLSLY